MALLIRWPIYLLLAGANQLPPRPAITNWLGLLDHFDPRFAVTAVDANFPELRLLNETQGVSTDALDQLIDINLAGIFAHGLPLV